MRFHNPIPRRKDELFYYIFLSLILPIVFVYDIFVVWPAIHNPGSFPYIFSLLTVFFLGLNAEGNLLASMLIDTSVDPLRMEIPAEGKQERADWRLCTSCERLAPPRSWHCKTCRTCILKRDHHCSFSGCCIGHQNQRYFMCFLLHLLLASFVTLFYNSIYIWVLNRSSVWKVLVLHPISNPFTDIVIKLKLSIYTLHILAFISAILALSAYVPIALRGAVFAEKETRYDRDRLVNLKSIFGQRMHLVWLSPLVKSELPEDGYNWHSKSTSHLNFTIETVL